MIVKITHTCGHIILKRLGGRIADRAKKISEMESRYCYDCSKSEKDSLQIGLFDRKEI